MAVLTHALDGRGYAPSLRTSIERFRGALLWLTGFAGAFVFMEPSPYEVASLLAIIVFCVTGLSLRPALMPLILLLILCNIGYSIAVIPVSSESKPVIWVLVSWYMASTAVFFAAALQTNTERRLELLTRGYTIAALVASLVAILAYFRLIPLADMFLRYDRARGTFNDSNVLGAFLIFPALLAVRRILTGGFSDVLRAGVLLVVMVAALFLSFSRAAWGQFAATSALLMFFMFITSRSTTERMRIIAVGIAGAVALGLFVVALLSIDQVANLFQERATLDQSYDTGHLGRFGRYTLGFALALEQPFGIGPLQFATIFPEDPHNTYLNEFMSGGWISGISYLAMTLVSVVAGLRFITVRTPWQPVYLAVYAAYLGVVGESAIIDTDHWRHYFLLLGVLWGLMAASRSYQRPRGPAASRSA